MYLDHSGHLNHVDDHEEIIVHEDPNEIFMATIEKSHSAEADNNDAVSSDTKGIVHF